MNKLEVLDVPHDVYVILTSRCNLRCLHCYGSFGEPGMRYGELSGDEWCRVFSEMSDLGVFFINIAGGEPTIHPEFPRIIDHLADIGLHFILTTNGLCDARSLQAIRRAADYIVGLKISLDGPTPESHARIRVGPDYLGRDRYFEKTMETVNAVAGSGIPLTIATCLHDANIGLIGEFKALIKEIHPVSWFISTIAPNGRAKQFYSEIFAPDSEYDFAYWAALKEDCRRDGISVRFIDMPTAIGAAETVAAFSCPAASSFCEINSDGLVSPCPLSRVNIPPSLLEFPNIRERSLSDIWRTHTSFATFRSWRTQGCSGCSALSGCGRCVAQSIEWFDGDPYQPTPFCVEKGELLGLDNLAGLRDAVDRKKRSYHDQGRIHLPIVQTR
jgi:radical SAM protein with 4Fe4S-binding SPASM domain